jgi:ATP-dependent RNA helicase DHX37/DHR1
VIATNVAETSLTIPSIRYVVDSGKVKQKIWDKLTGVQLFEVSWESKASAEQRAGRAGRVGPGHCYRLFSSAVFEADFDKYSTPEIQVRPVDDMMLLMKAMSIDRVTNFPFPSHPGESQLKNAEQILLALGALEPSANKEKDEMKITELGKTMARFPLGPRFSKMLALSFSTTLVPFVIALVSALSVQVGLMKLKTLLGDFVH